MHDLQITTGQFNGTEAQAVSARDLRSALGIRKDFGDWVKQQVSRLNLREETDFSPYRGRSNSGRETIEYVLTLDTAKNIAMMSNTTKAQEVRDYFIEVEKKYTTQQIAQPMSQIDVMLNSLQIIKDQERRIARIEARQEQNSGFTGFMTVVAFCMMKKIKLPRAAIANIGRKCSKLTKESDLVPQQVKDERWGAVNAYPEDIIEGVFKNMGLV